MPYLQHVADNIEAGRIDAVVLETYMSGGIPYCTTIEDGQNSHLGYVSKFSRSVPTFLVPQAHEQQEYPRRDDMPERCGGISLQTAYSAISDQVVLKIIETMKQTRDPKEVISQVQEHFRQTEWIRTHTTEWGTW